MASPQLENGFVAIAYDLYIELAAALLQPIEKDVMHAIIYLTYGVGKTKAAIRPEDIQILLSGARRIHRDRVEAAITSLTHKRLLYTSGTNGSLLGVQKDFEKWIHSNKSVHGVPVIAKAIKVNTNTITSNRDTVYRIQEYAYRGTEFHYGPSAWGVERKFAKLIYREALLLTGNPIDATRAIKDYIDELNSQEWFAKVKMRCRYMQTRFRQWYKQIPAKPRSIQEDEQITGYRFKYNHTKLDWERTNEELKPNT